MESAIDAINHYGYQWLARCCSHLLGRQFLPKHDNCWRMLSACASGLTTETYSLRKHNSGGLSRGTSSLVQTLSKASSPFSYTDACSDDRIGMVQFQCLMNVITMKRKHGYKIISKDREEPHVSIFYTVPY